MRACAAIDAAVAAKRRQLETLDALRKSIIQRAVTQGVIMSGSRWNLRANAMDASRFRQMEARLSETYRWIQGGITRRQTNTKRPLIERPYLRVGNVQLGTSTGTTSRSDRTPAK